MGRITFDATIDINGVDTDVEVTAGMTKYRPARFRGHPDTWEPEEGGEVEILSVVGPDGEEVDVDRFTSNRLEEEAVEAAEDQADDAAACAAEDRADDMRRGLL